MTISVRNKLWVKNKIGWWHVWGGKWVHEKSFVGIHFLGNNIWAETSITERSVEEIISKAKALIRNMYRT